VKSIHLLYCLPAAAALVLSGCSSDSGVAWGEEAGGGGTELLGAASASGATVRTGSISGDMISATVAIIAKHESSQRQREVAAQRGRDWSARHVAARQQHHYVAVDTAVDAHTAPAAARSVMIFDTDAQRVVGKDVYDVQTPPAVGSIARFDTYSAQYIGAGL
jgi:hypothetical protein